MVLGFFHVATSGEHHFNDHRVRFPLLRRDCSCVQVKRYFRVGVAEKFLSNLNIDSQKPQIRPQRMPEGVPCFAIGYAVPQPIRSQGRAKDVVSAAIAELQNGPGRYGALYIKAVVGTDNLASQRIAEHFISNAPVSIRDKHSGLPALQHVRKIEPPKAP
jgi:hypothetical protein